MNHVVKDILNKSLSKEAKIKLLGEVKKDIDLAEKVLAGEYRYCKECDDYYLADSFIDEVITEAYSLVDFINSDCSDLIFKKTYLVCPKAHRIEERMK